MSNNAKIREEAAKLNPIDDLLFRKMAEEKEFCEEILRVILEDKELTIIESVPQWTGANLQGRSVILDAKCIRGNGQTIDIEVQKSDNDDHQRRVRYNGSILTTNISDPGTKFEKVPDVCIVFISKFDIFKGNHALYHVDRIVRETGQKANNGFEEIYVSAIIRDGSEVSELMEVFVEDKVYNDKFPKTSESKHRYKETEGGIEIMSDVIERLTTEAMNTGIERGKHEGTLETLISLVKDGLLNIAEAAKRAGLTEAIFTEKMNQYKA